MTQAWLPSMDWNVTDLTPTCPIAEFLSKFVKHEPTGYVSVAFLSSYMSVLGIEFTTEQQFAKAAADAGWVVKKYGNVDGGYYLTELDQTEVCRAFVQECNR